MLNGVLDQLMRDEGFQAQPYRDTNGALTIGYGTNLEEGISTEEGRLLLESRLTCLLQQLPESLLADLPTNTPEGEARLGVIQNMVYQLGVHGLLQFHHLLAAVHEADWEDAATAMLDSKWAVETEARAHRLAEQMRTGKWQ